ncbi:uncharacterized protein PAC_09498 [Phialocephala subalpina]|uniref:Uncharacterized protein n=1 Tax=Phialocephala subalpina TaxID=576137 RepID=A0A1L7X3K5_9HELO|nr:uncharacterized protein PAC_09498 [Phialocephala subalpina]
MKGHLMDIGNAVTKKTESRAELKQFMDVGRVNKGLTKEGSAWVPDQDLAKANTSMSKSRHMVNGRLDGSIVKGMQSAPRPREHTTISSGIMTCLAPSNMAGRNTEKGISGVTDSALGPRKSRPRGQSALTVSTRIPSTRACFKLFGVTEKLGKSTS